MNKIFSLTVAVFLLMSSVVSSEALASRACDKLKTGIKELVTAPFAIATSTSEQVTKLDNKLLGLFAGIMEGSAKMTHQTISGVVNILTFPIDC